MGASIHMHLEVKSDGKWLHYAAPHIFRNPRVFDAMAGLYGGQPVRPVSGLPADLSEITRFCHEQDSGNFRLHHEGCLDADGIHALRERLRQTDLPHELPIDLEDDVLHCYINGNGFESHQGWDDARLVFWFDN